MEQASGRWEGREGAYFTQDDLGGQVLGVPHKVQVRPFTRLAKPKSVTCRHMGPGRLAGRAGGFRPGPPGAAPRPAQWAPECSPAGQ